MKLFYNGVYPCALIAYAGADCVHSGVLGINCNFSSCARFPAHFLNDYRTLLDFGHFLLEELSYQACGRTADEHLRTLEAAFYALYEHLYFVVYVVSFTGHLVGRKHKPLNLTFAEFYVYVFKVDFSYFANDKLAFLIGKLVHCGVALRFVELLQNYLFCSLRRDTAEVFGNEFFAH